VKRALTYCYFSRKNGATFFQGSNLTNRFKMKLIDYQLAGWWKIVNTGLHLGFRKSLLELSRFLFVGISSLQDEGSENKFMVILVLKTV
jgi:hypothetical protein